jgi:hypothetical protein
VVIIKAAEQLFEQITAAALHQQDPREGRDGFRKEVAHQRDNRSRQLEERGQGGGEAREERVFNFLIGL